MEEKLKNRILFISQYLFPNERTDAFLVTEIIKKLSNVNDGNIEVICTSGLEGKEELDFLVGKVKRLKSSRLNEKNLFSRIIKFIFLTFQLSFTTLFTLKKNDRLFLTTNPAFLLPVISLFRCFKKFEYTLLVYDVFPENMIAAKLIQPKSLLYKLSKKIYDWSYSKADRVIVLGRDMKEVVSEKVNETTSLHIIENWSDYKNIEVKNKHENSILKNLNIVEKKVFLFAGNLGRVQGIDTLLKASLLVNNPDFVLLFIGNGAFKNDIVEFISTNQSNNVYYGGSFPLAMQNDFLNACDVSIISLSDSMYGLGVPSKSYSNMAVQKPILYIGNKNTEIAQVVDEFNIGWVVSPNDAQTLAKRIDAICLESDSYISLGKKAREVVINNFSKEIILEKYAQLYRDNA